MEPIQWGDAPPSASTGVMGHHGRRPPHTGGAPLLTPDWFVGIDWATDAHDVCIVDREGRIVERRQVPHTTVGLQALVDALLKRAEGNPSRVAIGIEVPRGAVVEWCVERGFAVYSINPKQVDRFRDRFTVAGAKDDERDAHVIGDALRTDPQAFRRVRLDDTLVIQLREWSRVDEDLGAELTRLTNQLSELVYRIAPGVLALCAAANEAWFLDAVAGSADPQPATRSLAGPTRTTVAHAPHPSV